MAALTRLQLRHDTADQIGDLWLGTVTATSATTVTVPELVAPTNDWKGHELYVYLGTGIGQARKVTANGDQTGVLTVPAWTTEPTGASIEGHKRFTVDQYNRAINRAIRMARGYYVEVEDLTLTADADLTEYTMPTGLVWLASVESEATPGEADWFTLLRGDTLAGWDAAIGTLTVYAPIDLAGLRLRGYARPAEMDADTDVTELEPAYLVDGAAAALNASDIRAPALDRQSAAQQAAFWQTLAGAQLRRSALQDAVRVGD